MTDREKIAHLFRRFGFGATHEEIDAAVKAGLDATLRQLIEYDPAANEVNISPWEVAREEGTDEIYVDVPRFAGWWGLRMVMGTKPLQEKLNLFWHDHFAVSGSKVEFGPMMVAHYRVLNRHANGNFGKMLEAVSKDPAMIFWLDTHLSIKDRPNENFAREVMELFTLGIGNYTERDIQEAARAFTGWSIRYLIFDQGGENVQKAIKESVEKNTPMTSFSYSEELHDSTPKTILGKTKNWTGEEVLSELANHPTTARYVCKKLWEYFAYADPEPAIVERLAKAFTASKLEIKPVLYAIARSPEFYSEKCVRRQFKSPMDITIPLLRQLGIPAYLQGLHPKEQPSKPLPKPLRDIGGGVVYLGIEQGMFLFYPPDVAGWSWGANWISSDSLSWRTRMASMVMGLDSKDYGGAGALLVRIASLGIPATSSALVSQMLTVLDSQLPPAKFKLLVDVLDKAGGLSKMTTAESAAPILADMLKLLFASPDYQFC